MRGALGFTLIELVMVIVILGILSAVAIPSYIDLKSSAQSAAIQGVAGAMAAAMANNYAVRKAGVGGQAITNCNAVGSLLSGGIPTNYSVDSQVMTVDGVATTCTLHLTGYATAQTFQGFGA